MNKPYVTRYAKIVSSDEKTNFYKVSKKLDKNSFDFSTVGPCTNDYYRQLYIALKFNTNTILYPVRAANVYVLSVNGKSKIYDSNQKLYHDLIKKELINDTPELREKFISPFLNLFEISKLAGADLVEIPILNYMINEDDIYVKNILPDHVSYLSVVPCLYEKDKYVIELFFLTSSITNEIQNTLKNKKFKKIQEGFSIPQPAFSEMISSLSEYPF